MRRWFARLVAPERRKRLLVFVLLLLPAVLVALGFREAVRTLILLPLEYLLWIAGVLWRSIPQTLIWGIFVVVALRVAVGSLTARRRKRPEEAGPEGGERWGRARTWARWVELADQGGYFRRRLSRRLADLSLDVLAQRECLRREQVQEELQAGRLEVPPRIRAYLLAVLQEPPPGRLAWLRHIVWGEPAALQVGTEEIVAFLEMETAGTE